jgi:hypothetical protein
MDMPVREVTDYSSIPAETVVVVPATTTRPALWPAYLPIQLVSVSVSSEVQRLES